MSVSIAVEHEQDGFMLTATRRKRGLLRGSFEPVPIRDWTEAVVEGPIGRAALRRLLEDGGAVERDGALLVADDAAAGLDAIEANALGLPAPVPLPMEIRTRDQIASDDFRIWTRFVDGGGQPVTVEREGAGVRIGGSLYRLPRPLYDIVRAVEEVGVASDRDAHLACVARVRALLPEAEREADVRPDPLLDGITVRHAHAFALDVPRENGDVAFDPVPLGNWSDDGKDVEPRPLLSGQAARTFADDFRARGAADVHVLASGDYLFVDPALRPAMKVVSHKQRAPITERLTFLQHPERELERELGEGALVFVEGEDEPRSRFVPTDAYSARVVEIGEWVPPDLPFIKNAPSTWLPERFCVVLGDKVVTLGPGGVGGAKRAMRRAHETGQQTATVGGVEVPVDDETVAIVAGLPETEEPPPPEPEPEGDDGEPDGAGERKDEPPKATGPRVLIYHTNHHVAEFERCLTPRDLDAGEPAMRSTLRPHQVTALDWMRGAWTAGRPGVLLADDMGLGKTIEVLAFLAALRAGGETRPFLIVAPTSLLDNWTAEHDRHLATGLGEQVTAYGGGLRALREERGREHELGRALLAGGALGSSGFVLTTYETLRDYQFSFAAIEFAVAVYDETQKVKNPKSRMTASAKSINADFSIAMTGTPVENGMADLWSIADLVSPGMLPPLREFHREHTIERLDNLKVLRDALLDPRPDGTPPFALRRLKSEVVDLPALTEHTLRAPMEGDQALAYQETVNEAVATGGRERLRVLHDMRSISLHPIDPKRHPVPDDEAYIGASARMREAFRVLDRIHAEGAKAIVFLQSHKVQDILSDLVQRRYDLSAAPLIVRGDTPASRRQSFVDKFSATSGFGVIVLSPRAAGVGLNVTAATHVIHLDRWWNPAVEDQCTARAYRIGQDREVAVHYPMAIHPAHGEGSYDVVLDAILARKRELSRSLFVPADLSDEDFDTLLRGSAGEGTVASGAEADELRLIDERGANHLEDWIERTLRVAGLDVSGTPRSGDGGADAIVRGADGAIADIIQCKYTIHPDRSNPAPGLTDDLRRARSRWNAPEARFVAVTNAEAFSPNVRAALESDGALIVERADLLRVAELVERR